MGETDSPEATKNEFKWSFRHVYIMEMEIDRLPDILKAPEPITETFSIKI